MIARYYAKYVDLVAADRGILAFFKWFAAGVLLQLVVMLPALPLLALSVMAEADAAKYFGMAGFALAFAAARAFLFALPCARVAERKGLGPRAAWGAGGLLLGQWILGLAAALPPNAGRGTRRP